MELVYETERLRLRKMELSDAPFMLKLLNTPSWLQYIGDRSVHTVNDAEKFLQKGPLRSYEKDGFGFYIVELKKSPVPLGICGLVHRPELEDVDLGFAFLPEHERNGYGFESSLAVMQLAKETFGLQKLAAIATPDNHRSIRLLEKLGMKSEGTIDFNGEELVLMTKLL